MSTSYTIQAGDTLFSIANKLLGNGNLYTEITNAAGVAPSATQLQPGDVVYVPSAGAPAPRTPYTVQAGDTLFSIAQAMLGNGNLYTQITNANGTAPNPAQLQPGDVVYLPSSTASTSPAAPAAPASSGAGFASIVSRQTYASIFPNSNPLYTYDGLVAAAQTFPSFCNEGTLQQNQQEAAAFLANISHESGGLVFTDEQNPPIIYCDPSSTAYPCVGGQTYHGRGPLQLSWNFNYGACGAAIGKDLLNNPGLVSTDGTVTFMTALWFWMTTQPPKPSCHDAIRSSGFGMTINVINGGIECGLATPSPQAQHRIQLYQQYCGMLGVSPGNNLQC
jgi:predicted chitinase/LysM repeat protein